MLADNKTFSLPQKITHPNFSLVDLLFSHQLFTPWFIVPTLNSTFSTFCRSDPGFFLRLLPPQGGVYCPPENTSLVGCIFPGCLYSIPPNEVFCWVPKIVQGWVFLTGASFEGRFFFHFVPMDGVLWRCVFPGIIFDEKLCFHKDVLVVFFFANQSISSLNVVFWHRKGF